MRLSDRWHARRLTLEAMGLLVWARLLVARVPFAHWRGQLGRSVAPPVAALARSEPDLAARRLAGAIHRASARLPGRTRCLPQAMALQWMLRRRRLGGVLVIGVAGGRDRGGLADLHAWVVRDGEVLIGASDEPHHALYAARV